MKRNRGKSKKPKVNDDHYRVQGGPLHGTSLYLPGKDIPLVVPFEAFGGVYQWRNNVYVWSQED